MRTSRGLRVTSLVVLSPVILILLSLLAILTTTLFTQLQSLCPPLFSSTPNLISAWVPTDTLSGNSNDTLLLPTDDTNSPSYSLTSNSTVTITKSANTPSHYQHHQHHHRSSSLLHSWLKRGRCTKKNSSFLWPLCGLFLLFGYVYLHKSQVQKRQSIIRLTGDTCSVVSCWSKKIVAWMECLWTSQRGSGELSPTDMVWINDTPKLRNGSTKTTYAKGKEQHTRTTKPSAAPITQKHHIKKTKKQHQHQQQHQQRPTNMKCQPEISHKQSFSTDDTMEQDHVDMNDWINVGDKKKKDLNTDDAMESVQQSITYDDGNCIENYTNTIKVTLETADFDDDDKTVVEDLDHIKSHTTPTTSDDETELDSPSLSTAETSTTHHHHYFHHHHYHCHDHHHLEPVIRNWYSPFSTGLDIDILPPRSDPLTLLDPMQLRKQDNDHYLHSMTTQTPSSHHYLNQHFYDNFSLLQNHPFVNDTTHLQQSHQPTSLPLGAIGQHSPSSSPVQTSKQRTYSLFI